MEIEFEENVWSVQNKAAQVGAFCFDMSFFLYEKIYLLLTSDRARKTMFAKYKYNWLLSDGDRVWRKGILTRGGRTHCGSMRSAFVGTWFLMIVYISYFLWLYFSYLSMLLKMFQSKYNCLSFIITKILNILWFVKKYSFTKTITKYKYNWLLTEEGDRVWRKGILTRGGRTHCGSMRSAFVGTWFLMIVYISYFLWFYFSYLSMLLKMFQSKYNCLSFIIAKILNILWFVKKYSFTKTITKTLLVHISKIWMGFQRRN